jgi:hypothetical protein
MCARIDAMSALVTDVNEAVCWRCGAPANPDCARTVFLQAGAGQHKDGQSYPVLHHKHFDVVNVRVPRCKACSNLHWVCGFPGLIAWVTALLGLVAQLPWLLYGSLIVIFISGFAMMGYEGLGWRRTRDYPPLQRLREAGWEEI